MGVDNKYGFGLAGGGYRTAIATIQSLASPDVTLELDLDSLNFGDKILLEVTFDLYNGLLDGTIKRAILVGVGGPYTFYSNTTWTLPTGAISLSSAFLTPAQGGIIPPIGSILEFQLQRPLTGSDQAVLFLTNYELASGPYFKAANTALQTAQDVQNAVGYATSNVSGTGALYTVTLNSSVYNPAPTLRAGLKIRFRASANSSNGQRITIYSDSTTIAQAQVLYRPMPNGLSVIGLGEIVTGNWVTVQYTAYDGTNVWLVTEGCSEGSVYVTSSGGTSVINNTNTAHKYTFVFTGLQQTLSIDPNDMLPIGFEFFVLNTSPTSNLIITRNLNELYMGDGNAAGANVIIADKNKLVAFKKLNTLYWICTSSNYS